MATGTTDEFGYYEYGEDDLADPGQGFSDLLNKSARGVRAAVPQHVHSRVLAELEDDATLRQTAVALFDAEVSSRELVETSDERLPLLDVAEGKSFEFLDAQGRSTWLEANDRDGGPTKWAETLMRAVLRVFNEATPGYLFALTDANDAMTDLAIRSTDGQFADFVVQRLAKRLAPLISSPVVDAPYSPGAAWTPAHPSRNGAVWGSSTANGFTPALGALWSSFGAPFYGGGRGSERSCHILARMNVRRALVQFPGNTIPASGASAVTVPNFETYYGSEARSFTGTVAGIAGTLRYASDGTFTWTRTTPGDAVTLSGAAPMDATEGVAHRGDTVILNIGKNDVTRPTLEGRPTAEVIRERTRAAFEYLAPLHKRVLVMTHFADTESSAAAQAVVETINAQYRADYGSLVLDLNEWVLSAAAWTQTGISPTAEDRAKQAEGKKPPSLSLDGAHLNTAAYNAFTQNIITPKLTGFGWY